MHHSVSAGDMNEGKMEYAKFEKVGLNNCVSLSQSNMLQRAHQRARFHIKKYLGATLDGTLFHLCKSGQFYSNLTLVILLRSTGMAIRRAASIWNIMMSPHNIKMEDISNVVFDTMLGASNMR